MLKYLALTRLAIQRQVREPDIEDTVRRIYEERLLEKMG